MERLYKNSTEEIAKKLAILTEMVKRPRRKKVNLNNTEIRGSKGGTVGDESRTCSFTYAVYKDTTQTGSGASLKPPDPIHSDIKRDMSPKHKQEDNQGKWSQPHQIGFQIKICR